MSALPDLAPELMMALRAAVGRLRQSSLGLGHEGAAFEARRLAQCVAQKNLPLSQQLVQFDAMISRRCRGEPFSHITQSRSFYLHDFYVTADVLDPRPDTETLVVHALEHPWRRVLDLGTGSGCILCSLLAARVEARGIGGDISPKALEVARENARRTGTQARAEFILSDWFVQITGSFDLIVANPPYISAQAYREIAPEVRNWEPELALTPGGDGLAGYRRICKTAPAHLTPGGLLAVEIGYDQAQAVSVLFEQAGFAEIQILPDINQKDRVVSGKLRQKCGKMDKVGG